MAELSDRLDKHHVYMIASGIAFNLLIYALPLALVILYVIDLVFGVKNINPFLENLFSEFLPPTPAVKELLGQLIKEANSISDHISLLGIIGIGLLFWVASLLISSIRIALNVIFEMKAKHYFLIYRLKDIFLTFILTVVIFLYTYAFPLYSFVYSFFEKLVPKYLHYFISNSFILIVSLSSSFIVFYVIYGLIPNQKLPAYIKFRSSLLSAVAIELGRRIFGYYITYFSNYGRFYGGVAILAAMAAWLYYSSLIILFSAEIVKFIHDKQEEKKLRLMMDTPVKKAYLKQISKKKG
ncbi:MAG: YihY/virulence factor BrkB family protein [bacterium]